MIADIDSSEGFEVGSTSGVVNFDRSNASQLVSILFRLKRQQNISDQAAVSPVAGVDE